MRLKVFMWATIFATVAGGGYKAAAEPSRVFSIPVEIVQQPAKDQQEIESDLRSETREAEDLAAQKSMAESTYRMLLVNGFQLALGLIGTGALFYTLLLTRRSVATADSSLLAIKETGQNEMRAYVHVPSAHLLWNKGAAHVMIDCANTGQTPAPYFSLAAVGDWVEKGRGLHALIPELPELQTYSALTTDKDLNVRLALADSEPFPDMNKAQTHVFTVRGRVEYGDIFGDDFVSEFTFFVHQVGQLTGKEKNPGWQKMSAGPAKLKVFHRIS